VLSNGLFVVAEKVCYIRDRYAPLQKDSSEGVTEPVRRRRFFDGAERAAATEMDENGRDLTRLALWRQIPSE